MICPKCHKELPEGSLFCPSCGYNIKRTTTVAKNSKNIKKLVIILAIAVVVVFAGVFSYNQIRSSKLLDGYKKYIAAESYSKAGDYFQQHQDDSFFVYKANKYVEKQYQEAVKANNTEKQVSIFNSSLLPDEYIAKLKKDISSEIDNLQKSFIANDVSIDDVQNKCNVYINYDNKNIHDKASKVKEYCFVLSESRKAYDEGLKDIDAKNYKEALDKLSKVIKEDSNYDSAQSKINEVVKLYKKEVMSKVDKDLSSKKYSEALNALKSLNNYCSDTDVKDKMDSVRDKKNAYDKKEQKRRIKKYKNNQEVEVISTKVVDAGYSLVFMNAYVTVKNNTSNKVAKDVELGMLLFDGNGYPVDADDLYKITYDNEESCELDSCNITPGKTYGSNSYFDVPDQCKKIKACVQEVTYTDGTVWENPYYNYWVDANYQSY